MAERTCGWCGGGMDGKRSHAVYCTRSCKSKACHDRLRRDNPAERDRNRVRYEKERERRLAEAKAYAKRRPEVAQVARRKRRDRERSAEQREVTARDWLRLQRRYDHRCAYCDERGPLTMEHIVPLSRGGRHAIGNLLPVCNRCNPSKKTRLLIEYRRDLRRLGSDVACHGGVPATRANFRRSASKSSTGLRSTSPLPIEANMSRIA